MNVPVMLVGEKVGVDVTASERWRLKCPSVFGFEFSLNFKVRISTFRFLEFPRLKLIVNTSGYNCPFDYYVVFYVMFRTPHVDIKC